MPTLPPAPAGQRRHSLHLVGAFALAAAALAAQDDGYARAPKLRQDVTIFSPLDLPTPNRQRTASGAPGPDYWQQRVDYRIAATLDPEARTVTGKEHITYHNHSPEALDYLWVHLEQNILRKDSIGAQIGGGAAVGGDSDYNDGVQLGKVAAGATTLAYHVYDTMMRVDLPQPIAAGATFEFDIEWSFAVPQRVFRRYGTMETPKGTIWELAQWFPAVAVYDDVHGWNTLPYIGTGEFYMNFGDVELALTVPRDHLVVASGVLQNPEQVYTTTQLERFAAAQKSRDTIVIRGQDEVGDPSTRPAGEGPLTWRFRAENVRTVAWASSPAFLLDACTADGVLVQSAYSEASLPVWSQSTAMLATAIEGYNKRWFPYPYPVATNVAGIEGGMEYPMIIFCSGRNRRSEGGLYGVTTHEIGHNWFPMLVNTDERRHAWMDEGFNTFINKYSTADWFKDHSPNKPSSYAGMLRAPGIPVVTRADRLNGMQLGILQYEKTGVGLQILREYILGPERFDHAFRTYIRRWAFKSPQPADFFRTMEDAAGMDLAWFWRGWFLEDAMFDQAIERVRQPTSRIGARVVVVNKERQVMPLTLRATFVDGSTETRRLPVELWFQSDRVSVTLESLGKVKEVRLDPEQMLPDVDRSNNVWTAETESK
ncbi:MAG: M1 family metallopeptidase [Planctomycetes bacterium]|nr:M1 family metallopeptidase [Planctomycetota bacterium]